MSETPEPYGPQPPRRITLEADAIVYGARRPHYPPPALELWAAGEIRAALDAVAEANDDNDLLRPARLAAIDRIVLKVVRLAYAYKRDSCVDLAGYAAMLADLYEAHDG